MEKNQKEALLNTMKRQVEVLFDKLVNSIPTMIDDREFIYNIDGMLVKLWWKGKIKDDNEKPVTTIEGFFDNPNSIPNKFRFCTTGWDIIYRTPENSEEGFTFFIETPAGKFIVPPLSRKKLIDVQEQLERAYSQFLTKYLDELIEGKISSSNTITKSSTIDWNVKF